MRKPTEHVNPATGETYFRVRYRRDGKQRALSFYGDQAEIDAAEFALLLDKLGADRAVTWWNTHLDDVAGDGLTLAAWWPRYLKSLTRVTDGTRDAYDRLFRRIWLEPLGARPLTTITREDIAEVVNDLSTRLADKTVANAYGVLTGCLGLAVLDGHIPVMPTKGIALPRRTEHETAEMRYLDHAEWARLHDKLPKHYRPLFTFLVGTGARWGEAEALEVRDVDLDAFIVHADGSIVSAPTARITKAAKWNASSATRKVGPTKTKRSRRTITLPPEVVDELVPLLDRPKTARLFLAPRGGPLRHKTAYDEWTKACDAAQLVPRPRIHDLRHTQVAWLIAARIPLPVIQARLGHESIKTTSDRYGHLLPDLQLEAANAASLAMRPRELPGTPAELNSPGAL